MKRGLSVIVAVMLVFFSIDINGQESESGHSHEQAQSHSGKVVMTQDHHFEVVPMMHGLSVFGYDYNQNPIDVSDVTGSVTIMTQEGETLAETLNPYNQNRMNMDGASGMSGEEASMMNSMLYADINLEDIDAQEVKVVIELENLPGDEESEVTFRETLDLADLPEDVGSMMGTAGMMHE